jgi:cell division protein FtsL
VDEFSLGYLLLFLFVGVILTAWLTIDDEDFNRKFERHRKSRFEDEEI